MLRKKREVEEYLNKEYDKRNSERLPGRPERFGRPLTPMPFGNEQESLEERGSPEGISYTNQGAGSKTGGRGNLPYDVTYARGQQPAGERQKQIAGVVLHYTGSNEDTIKGLVANSQDRKHPGRGYDYVITRDGRVVQMNDPKYYTNHIQGAGDRRRSPDTGFRDLSNDNTLSVGIVGDGKDVTKEQLFTAPRFLDDMVRVGKIPESSVATHGMLQGNTNKEPNEAWKIYDAFTQYRQDKQEFNPQAFDLDPFPSDATDVVKPLSPAVGPEVAAAPGTSAGQVSSVPTAPAPGSSSQGFRVPTFGELTGITTPVMGKGAGGMPAFKNQVTIPQEDMGASISQAAGPELPFPELPPPPPRTPPGTPTFADRRRRGRFA